MKYTYVPVTVVIGNSAEVLYRKVEDKIEIRRKKCPVNCDCLCHDMGGGPVHHGEPCPGKKAT